MTTLQEAAANGARLLDEVDPEWALKLDLSTLDLNDCFDCVLGQLFGDYTKGLFSLAVPPRTIHNVIDDYGFDLDSDDLENPLWNELTEAWIAEAKKRIDRGIEL